MPGDKSHPIGMTKVYLCALKIISVLKTYYRSILSFFFVLFSMFATAQQHKFSGWGMTVNTIALSPKFNLIFDSQLRSNHQWKQPETFILRPGLTYVLNKNVSLSTGFALIQNWKTIQGLRDGVSDNRIWQQLIINNQLKNAVLQHRFRMEERWIPVGLCIGTTVASVCFLYSLLFLLSSGFLFFLWFLTSFLCVGGIRINYPIITHYLHAYTCWGVVPLSMRVVNYLP